MTKSTRSSSSCRISSQTGHLLGRALASLFAFQLAVKDDNSIVKPINCITSASPRNCNYSLARAFLELELQNKIMCLRNANDKIWPRWIQTDWTFYIFHSRWSVSVRWNKPTTLFWTFSTHASWKAKPCALQSLSTAFGWLLSVLIRWSQGDLFIDCGLLQRKLLLPL